MALRWLAADLVVWFALPVAFLAVCVSRDLLPADAVLPHLRLALLLLLGLTALRLILVARLNSRTAVHLATAFVASVVLAVIASYYLTVVISLQSWGRVPSWELFRAYAPQVRMLAEVLEVSLPLVAGAALLAWLALFVAGYLYFRRFDWTPFLRRASAPWLFALAAYAGGAVALIELYNFVAAPPAGHSEPVALTFWPSYGASNHDGHDLEFVKAAILDAAEDRERSAYHHAPDAQRRNVILIVVDALRPDHMGVYGYARDTTPTLARLEKAGALRKVDAVRASCASSFCGLMSMASAKFLHQLSARPITLQEVLRRHGYRIHMLLTGDHVGFFGLRAAYGEVDAYADSRTLRRVGYVNDDRIILEHLAGYPSWDGTPVMMQFHLMGAHPLHDRNGRSANYAPAANYFLYREPGAERRPTQRGINFYDNGVQHADEGIHAILQTLERKGYLRDALVVITADHGEALGEHGLYQHGNSVREEALRIPLLLLSYGYRPTKPLKSRSLASQADIAPTILAELGMPRPATWTGTALQDPAARDFLPFQERWEAGVYDLRDPRNLWKYWVNLKTGEEMVFNLTRDPREDDNVIGDLAAPLKRQLQRQVVARGPVNPRRRFTDPDYGL
jgi:glucan phosphoethanolaminetransferase (alkaline phosphatase superfamily)